MTSTRHDIVLKVFRRAFRWLRWIAVLLIVVFLGSGVTKVQHNEVALVLRLGRLVGATRAEQIRQPGPLFCLPYPVDQIIRVPVKEIRELKIESLWRPLSGQGSTTQWTEDDQSYPPPIDEGLEENSSYAEEVPYEYQSGGDTIDPLEEGYCLTGDRNVIQPRVVVKYHISDPIAYALRTHTPEDTCRTFLVKALTQSVAEMSVDTVLAEGKKRLAHTVKQRTQAWLEETECGISIDNIEFKELVPPRHVIREFQAVTSAYIERETKIKKAQAYRAREIPAAEAQRDRMIREAEGYRSELMAKAKGEVTAFTGLLEQYRKSPEVVRTRLFRESMEVILGQVQMQSVLPSKGPDDKENPVRLMIPGAR